MKRVILLLTIATLLCLLLVGCSCATEEEPEEEYEEVEGLESDLGHTHRFDDWVEIKAPGCNENGLERRTCRHCDESEEREIAATGEHTRGEPVIENRVAATCQSEGSYEAVVYCTVCNNKLESSIETIEKTDHALSVIEKTGEYCGDVPISKVYCGACREYVTSYGHKYEETSLLPTCTERGYNRKTCALCGDCETEYISAFGHLESGWEADKEASCQWGGHLVNKCMLCSVVIEEKDTEKLEHSYVSTVEGEILKYSCVSCSDSYTEEIEGDVFTVDFVTNGGNTCQSITVKSGDVVNLPEVAKDGYCLSGWYYDDGGKAEYFDDPIFEDTTLYALWQEKEKVSIEDHAIELSVGTDFAFDVIVEVANTDNVLDYVTVYDLSDKKVNVRAVSKGNGMFTIISDEYKAGEFYYAAVKSPARFSDTEQTEKHFTIKGEDRYNVAINDSVIYVDSLDVYGIIDSDGEKFILSSAELSVGKNVAIYEGTKENITSVVKIKSKTQMHGFNAYAFELANYEEVFDEFDVYVATDFSFENFQMNPEAVEEIKAQFLSSPLYKQAKSAAESLADAENIKLKGEPEIKQSIEVDLNNGTLIVGIKLIFEFDNDFKITINITNEIGISGEAYFKSLSKYSFVATTTIDTNVKIEASLDIDEGFFKGDVVNKTKGQKKYKELIEKYKTFFNQKQFEKIGLDDQKGDLKKHIVLGHFKIRTSGIQFYVDVGFDAEFYFGGAVGIDLNLQTVVSLGIRNGGIVKSASFDLKASSLFARAKIEINPKFNMEIGANACGLILYINGNVGPYFDAGIVGVISYDGEQMIIPEGGAYLEFGIKYGATVGLKYEISVFGEEIKFFDIKYTIVEKKIPARTYGTNKIAVGFVKYEDFIENDHSCESGLEISLEKIDTRIIKQSLSTLKFEETEAECQITLKSVSGYASQIKLKDEKLIIGNVPGDVTVVVRIRYNDVITKDIQITVKATHPSGCIHKQCFEHTGGMLTCISKAICENCGVEYGEEPKGHVWQDIICSVCGDYKGSEGLEYELTGEGYCVSGVGSCTDDVIIIPSTYNGLPVTYIGYRAFYDCDSLTSIVIPSSVTSIGAWAFSDCDRLDYNKYDNALYLGNKDNPYLFLVAAVNDSITSCEINANTRVIGWGAFYACHNLTSVSFKGSSQLTNIDDSAFYDCDSLTSIVIPSGVTRIGGSAFEFCESLTSIEIPSSVTIIGLGAFEFCKSLTSVNYLGTIESWCSIEYYSATDNPLSNGADFYLNGRLLTEVVIPNTVASINKYAFYNCKSLVSVTFAERSQLRSIGKDAFNGCVRLTSVEFPRGVVSIGDRAFCDCYSLTSIIIPSSVTSIGYLAFTENMTIYCEAESMLRGWDSHWRGSASVVWDCNDNDVADDGYIYSVKDGIRYGIKDNVATVVNQSTNIEIARISKSITYKGKDYSVTSIGESAFDNCDNLISVIFEKGDRLTSIGERAFYDCDILQNIEIPSSVTSIGEDAFFSCYSLTSVTIKESSQLVSICEGAFSNCYNLRSIVIPSSVTSIGSGAFYHCDNLTSVFIPSSVTNIGKKAFSVSSSNYENLTIYCEAESKPSGWNDGWKLAGTPVVWGYKG